MKYLHPRSPACCDKVHKLLGTSLQIVFQVQLKVYVSFWFPVACIVLTGHHLSHTCVFSQVQHHLKILFFVLLFKPQKYAKFNRCSKTKLSFNVHGHACICIFQMDVITRECTTFEKNGKCSKLV